MRLSFIVPSRNDAYCGNYHYRLSTSINYLARNLERAGRLDDVEYLLVDWGSETPLREALDLTPAGRKIVRCLEVDLPTSRRVCPDKTFSAVHACNVALRRCKGDYAMLMDSDGLWPLSGLRALFRLLDGVYAERIDAKFSYFLIPRIRIGENWVRSQPSLDEWDRILLTDVGNFTSERMLTGGSAQGILMHRERWHELRGLDEKMAAYGWNDIDLMWRATQTLPWIHTSTLGIEAYHMNHGEPHRDVSVEKNMPVYLTQRVPNDENWGLPKEQIHPTSITVFTPCAPAKKQKVVFEHLIRETANEYILSRVKEAREQTERFYQESGTPYFSSMSDSVALGLFLTYHILYQPKSVLTLGVRDPLAIAFIGGGNLDPPFFCLHDWEDGSLVGGRFYISGGSILHRYMYRGYYRQITGDPKQALQTLKAEPLRPGVFDLVVYNLQEDAERDIYHQTKELQTLLSSTGLMVLMDDPTKHRLGRPLFQKLFKSEKYDSALLDGGRYLLLTPHSS